MREYKYSKKCPYCGEWFVLALSDAQKYLPNVYKDIDGIKRGEGHRFDLKATITMIETPEEVDELIEELDYHKVHRLKQKKQVILREL